MPPSIQRDPECLCAKLIDYKWTRYAIGMVLILGEDQSRCLRFGEILFIIPEKDNVHFIYSPLLNLGLNAHVRGFEIEKPKQLHFLWVRSDSLFDPTPLSVHSMVNGEIYVILRYI